MNIPEAFKKTALIYPDKPMVFFQHQTYTFQQMDHLSDRLAGGLSAIGVQTGDILSIGLMRGYYNRKDLTDKALRGGWYHTGDLGRLDRDGFLYIVDRKDDMINAGAFKIYPREVEEVLYTHPDVQDCAVVGVPDDRLGQIPVAYVVTEKRNASILPELKTFCTRKIANYKVPRHFHHVKELPRTPQGKVMERMLTEIRHWKEQ